MATALPSPQQAQAPVLPAALEPDPTSLSLNSSLVWPELWGKVNLSIELAVNEDSDSGAAEVLLWVTNHDNQVAYD